MQSQTTLAGPTKMGDLNTLPNEIIGMVLENLTVGDVVNMMSLNKYSYDTITDFRHTIIPTLFSLVKRHQITEVSGTLDHRSNTWQSWLLHQPPKYQSEETFKLLRKVAKKIKTKDFGDLLKATTAGENQCCSECGAQVKWTDVRTGRPRCEKCAVWSLSPLLDETFGIIWSFAAGKVCILINLAADRQCREKKEQGQKSTETPFIK